MTIEQIFTDVLLELERARRLHPAWPTDIVHAAALMTEEAGETLKEANNYYFGHKGGTLASIRQETLETMATCVRLLIETPCLAQVFPGNQALSLSKRAREGGGNEWIQTKLVSDS